MGKMNKRQEEEYLKFCREKARGRLLTSDAIVLICDAYDNDAEKIGKHFIEIASRIKNERIYGKDENDK